MWLKFVFDRVVSFLGLIILLPVFVVVAILVKVKMPGGPVFFSQKRVGRNGRLFTMHKFRTMTVDHNGSSVSVAGESRITPLGAKLRRYKLDELPAHAPGEPVLGRKPSVDRHGAETGERKDQAFGRIQRKHGHGRVRDVFRDFCTGKSGAAPLTGWSLSSA